MAGSRMYDFRKSEQNMYKHLLFTVYSLILTRFATLPAETSGRMDVILVPCDKLTGQNEPFILIYIYSPVFL